MGNTVDLRGIVRTALELRSTKKRVPQLIQRAQGTLARRLAVEARRDIQQEYRLKAARIAQDIAARRDGEAVVLTGYFRGINAIEFGGRWRRTWEGARYNVRRQGPTSSEKGAFIGRGRGHGKPLILIRKGKARLPIVSVYGPTVAQMLRRPDRAERLADFAQEIASKEMERLTK